MAWKDEIAQEVPKILCGETSAWGKIEALLDSVSSEDLAWLDLQTRHWGFYDSKAFRRHVCKGRPAALLGIASFHRDGYVRQAALESLAEIHTGKELPFLLLRLNDWVLPVSSLAEKLVNQRIQPAYAGHFIRNLPLVMRLKAQKRAAVSDLATNISALIARPECRPAVKENLETSDRAVRRLLLQIALEARVMTIEESIRFVRNEADGVTRLLTLRNASKALQPQEILPLLAATKHDRFMPVRRECLEIFIKHFPEKAPSELRSALLDRHAGIREIARFYLPKFESFDAAEFYRKSLSVSSERELPYVIRGLGECGRISDVDIILLFVKHTLARARCAALYALHLLAGKEQLLRILEYMEDSSPAVMRAAYTSLRVHAALLPPERLQAIYDRNPKLAIRRRLLNLGARLQKWPRILFLLQKIPNNEECLRYLSIQHIQKWLRTYNRNPILPTPDQLSQISTALSAAKEYLPNEITCELSLIFIEYRIIE